ncbi:MAG TPA: hypothetical protein VKT77_03975 [Chthonomonadaceae bacterium]|nr:hypothetical protein [Chthonomonadaceae bacterium]
MDQEISGRAGSPYDLPPDAPEAQELPEFQAAVHAVHEPATRLPSLEDAPRDKPVRANPAASNGNGSKPKEPTSLFWQQPISADEEVNWFVPPLPRREDQTEQVAGLLNELSGMVPHMPMRSWLAKWNFHTRAAASAAEQVDVEREAEKRFAEQIARGEVDGRHLDEQIQALEARELVVENDLTEAQKGFAEAAARAGLSCEPDPHRLRNADTPPSLDKRLLSAPAPTAKAAPPTPDAINDLNFAPSGIGPQSVEEALQVEVPDLDAVAGQQGVSPIPRQTLWGTILTFFMQFLAPLVCGFMLALCLGTLVGILDLDDFSRRDSVPKFILSAALGFVIVYLMGELFSNLVHAITRALEMKADLDMPIPSVPVNPAAEDRTFAGRLRAFGEFRRPGAPRLRAGLAISFVLIVVACILGLAEVTAEAFGIQELHRQQIARRDRFRSPLDPRGEQELWFPVYILIGTLISGPYLMYKASRSWGEGDVQLREAWLLNQQRIWIDDRRARPETGLAFQAATRVEHLENRLYDIKIQLKTLRERRSTLFNPQPDSASQVRRKEARAAAVGEALRLQTMIEEMVNMTEPLPSSQPPPTPSSYPQSAGGQSARVIHTRQ